MSCDKSVLLKLANEHNTLKCPNPIEECWVKAQTSSCSESDSWSSWAACGIANAFQPVHRYFFSRGADLFVPLRLKTNKQANKNTWANLLHWHKYLIQCAHIHVSLNTANLRVNLYYSSIQINYWTLWKGYRVLFLGIHSPYSLWLLRSYHFLFPCIYLVLS